MADRFFCIRNFEKFQHYTDRRPPWIKLYRDLWDDPRFFDLSDTERYMLIGIFVIASQHENRVSSKQSWLKAKLLTSKAIPLQKLIDTGWVDWVEQDASNTLADSSALAERYPSRARGETETETETETEVQRHISLTRGKRCFGENVLLSEEEYGKLVDHFGQAVADDKIHGADLYIGSTGKKYRSHYMTILNWERKNGNGTHVAAATVFKDVDGHHRCTACKPPHDWQEDGNPINWSHVEIMVCPKVTAAMKAATGVPQ